MPATTIPDPGPCTMRRRGPGLLILAALLVLAATAAIVIAAFHGTPLTHPMAMFIDSRPRMFID